MSLPSQLYLVWDATNRFQKYQILMKWRVKYDSTVYFAHDCIRGLSKNKNGTLALKFERKPYEYFWKFNIRHKKIKTF